MVTAGGHEAICRSGHRAGGCEGPVWDCGDKRCLSEINQAP